MEGGKRWAVARMAAGTEPRSTEPLIHRPHTRVSSVGLAKKERLRSKFPNWLRTHYIDDLQGIMVSPNTLSGLQETFGMESYLRDRSLHGFSEVFNCIVVFERTLN